jgi:hypothetical protein
VAFVDREPMNWLARSNADTVGTLRDGVNGIVSGKQENFPAVHITPCSRLKMVSVSHAAGASGMCFLIGSSSVRFPRSASSRMGAAVKCFEIAALCDVDQSVVDSGVKTIEAAGKKRPHADLRRLTPEPRRTDRARTAQEGAGRCARRVRADSGGGYAGAQRVV